LRFFHFLKREKNWWMMVWVEENIFFSLNKRNVSESTIFFSCAAHYSVFFLFFFANVQKVSISIGGWWSNFFWGIASSGPILVRAQTFQKGAVLFYYMLLMLFMGKHILP